MTIKEAEDFYETDTMQYNFNCRENFKPWFKNAKRTAELIIPEIIEGKVKQKSFIKG